MRVSLLAGFALAAAGCMMYVQAQDAATLQESVRAMAIGPDSPSRRDAILARLKSNEIPYSLEDFASDKFSGTNIVVVLPGPTATRTLLLGAHYDRVPVGEGAVDNAASCAIVLSLLTTLKASPLTNYSVIAVFFDREEGALAGSQAYFEKHAKEHQPDEAVNLDIFGYGDTFFGVESKAGGPLAKAIKVAANDAGLEAKIIPPDGAYPPSDHRNMIRAGIDTLGLAMIDRPEVEDILNGNEKEMRVLSIIHTAKDTPDETRPKDMDRGRLVLLKKCCGRSMLHRDD